MRISDWSSDVCSSDLRTGRTIYRHDDRSCEACNGAFARPAAVPPIIANREQLADPVSIYQVTSMLQAVIERGTATRVRMPGRPLAGKTGTTNDAFDSWFVGYSTSLVARTTHTSELQSLMRISYAVFCLKTTNKTT